MSEMNEKLNKAKNFFRNYWGVILLPIALAATIGSLIFIVQMESEKPDIETKDVPALEISDRKEPIKKEPIFDLEGRPDKETWDTDFENLKAAALDLDTTIRQNLSDLNVFTEETKAVTDVYLLQIQNAKTIAEIEDAVTQLNWINDGVLASIAENPPVEYYYDDSAYYGGSNGGGGYTGGGYSNDFQSQGTVYENGIAYKYYSSNVLYHYRTPEWSLNSSGFYQTGDGYLVVASSDHPQGTIVNTPWGPGQVLDSGCDSGVIDMYTGF